MLKCCICSYRFFVLQRIGHRQRHGVKSASRNRWRACKTHTNTHVQDIDDIRDRWSTLPFSVRVRCKLLYICFGCCCVLCVRRYTARLSCCDMRHPTAGRNITTVHILVPHVDRIRNGTAGRPTSCPMLPKTAHVTRKPKKNNTSATALRFANYVRVRAQRIA